ncbi:hypothetical protein TVAG_303320 [Trichomonas vaginalis G3]|uniref:F5/8 type C domain-containing protein n=1 Tax=Trichomonas vaginalis (strain ATCC PRA-98 / G3) TaxID=412133 RepID=A2DR14_TRIV3|nr:hypothetical protein TVAGG3_0694540 [Trichomonas vaginalis G3]EAY17113.1 hypothetical protein TVAG_303320 [Trichomonas vaginalis G3]KAI5508823.1 hypothetical protein TVAGG3_0694540 [Trichomonas vaginalis G3]|eukprot:XP_001329336.1 hypothetical protein [Trichomonas vaginalis G3]
MNEYVKTDKLWESMWKFYKSNIKIITPISNYHRTMHIECNPGNPLKGLWSFLKDFAHGQEILNIYVKASKPDLLNINNTNERTTGINDYFYFELINARFSVEGYSIKTGKNQSGDYHHWGNSVKFSIEGSQDGAYWAEIDTSIDRTNNSSTVYTFKCKNVSDKYKYLRLYYKSGSGNNLGLYNIEFFGFLTWEKN